MIIELRNIIVESKKWKVRSAILVFHLMLVALIDIFLIKFYV